MDMRHAVEVVGLAVDAAGVGIIVVSIGIAGVRFMAGMNRDQPFDATYRGLRQSIGRGILLGLEVLVAGDIIRTVAVAPTFAGVGVLAPGLCRSGHSASDPPSTPRHDGTDRDRDGEQADDAPAERGRDSRRLVGRGRTRLRSAACA